jgi:hypothetical protein
VAADSNVDVGCRNKVRGESEPAGRHAAKASKLNKTKKETEALVVQLSFRHNSTLSATYPVTVPQMIHRNGEWLTKDSTAASINTR